MPPVAVRRVLFVPVLPILAVVLACLFLPVVVLAGLVSLLGDGRYRSIRLLRFALAWVFFETWAVAACTLVWLGSPLGGRVRTERLWERHYSIIRRYIAGLYGAGERYLNLRVEVEGEWEAPGPERDPAPLIVLSRHAGPGDSLILVHHLLTHHHRRPRLVMKDFLQLDPCIDIAAGRLPNVFVRSAGSGMTGEIGGLADRLGPADALVIFPEGGNFTAPRRRRAIRRLLRLNRRDQALRATRMRNVMPPRPGGALAAVEAAPGADVVFVAHTGLERLNSLKAVWQGLPLTFVVRARWWRVPAEAIPAGRRERTDWLFTQWERIDAWIAENSSAVAPRGEPG
ncbi:1-acyl-sn-glycerol-3-phosphate acyltransferase [Actinocorallia longicatena]|uniref:Lysophospholipid acyltransferase family protein n=1 Tax=Actinocorallia longicatena TaxID=111803 RepID=A0ABP6QMD2_9ACTN